MTFHRGESRFYKSLKRFEQKVAKITKGLGLDFPDHLFDEITVRARDFPQR
jgi:hypothetical protein